MIDHEHDQLAIVCRHVVEDGLPVLYVSHDNDGDWQFLCGGNDHVRASDGRLACWTCVMRQDPSLTGIEHMAVGWKAERNAGDGRWYYTSPVE